MTELNIGLGLPYRLELHLTVFWSSLFRVIYIIGSLYRTATKRPKLGNEVD